MGYIGARRGHLFRWVWEGHRQIDGVCCVLMRGMSCWNLLLSKKTANTDLESIVFWNVAIFRIARSLLVVVALLPVQFMDRG